MESYLCCLGWNRLIKPNMRFKKSQFGTPKYEHVFISSQCDENFTVGYCATCNLYRHAMVIIISDCTAFIVPDVCSRALLCPEVLPGDRDLREGAEGWAGVEAERSSEAGGRELRDPHVGKGPDLPLEPDGIPGDVSPSTSKTNMTLCNIFVVLACH